MLAFCVWMTFWRGSELSPTANQLTKVFASLFAAGLLFVGSSTASLQGSIRGVTFRATGAAALGLMFYLVLYWFAPAADYRAVSLYLEHRDEPIPKDFRAIIRVAGIDPIIRRGEKGVLLFQLPATITQIENVSIEECAGYARDGKQKGPFHIPRDGVIRLAIIKTVTPPPRLPEQFPSVQAIPKLPERAEVEAAPRVDPEQVTFKYKNLTDANLRLLLFSCWKHYRKDLDPLAPTSPWWDWEFPAMDEYQVFDRFRIGRGWFCFFVVSDRPSPAGSDTFFLGCHDLFASKRPTLTVTETKDPNNPYSAIFGRESEP
jgi:hypothetical protein